MFGNFTTSYMKGLKVVAFLAIFQLNDDEELFDGVLKKVLSQMNNFKKPHYGWCLH